MNYIFKALFCHGTSLKKPIWPHGDLNLRRWCQSTDMLATSTRPSCMHPQKREIQCCLALGLMHFFGGGGGGVMLCVMV